MSVNEADATLAVEAAARRVYETNAAASAESLRRAGVTVAHFDWDKLDPIAKREFKEAVLPIVWTALKALPDRSRGLWLEGYYAHEAGIREEACPYPLV